MFEKKQYYISKFSYKNRYCVEKELESVSCYEKWILVQDEYRKEYAVLFERIGNELPNLKELYFERPIHESILYPLDLIEKSNVYVYENEVGFVYPAYVLAYETFEQIMKTDKKNKVKYLRLLCAIINDMHIKKIYLMGFDKKQIMIENGKIRIRYNGFQNHNRNSIYRVPDYLAKRYISSPWILDIFSLVIIIFECMYEWNPFLGTMTSFSSDEEHQFDIFYNNFGKKMFVFEKEQKMNQIGFLMGQRKILEKWSLTESYICRLFESILTLNIQEDFSEKSMFLKVKNLITYYEESEVFQ